MSSDGWEMMDALMGAVKDDLMSDKKPTQNLSDSEKQAVIDFYNRVCAMAEQKIMMTHKLEGAHYASMQQLIKEYR